MTERNHAPTYPDRSPELMYDVAKSRLETQLAFIDAVDTKIGMLVSLATALLGIAAAVFALHGTATASAAATSLTAADLATLSVGGAVYVVMAALGLWAYFSREWDIGPKLASVWARQRSDETDVRLKWEVANDFMHYYENNLPACERKNRSLPWLFAATVAETVLLVTSLSLVAAGA